MANRSFLTATNSKQVFPQLRKPREKIEIVACGNWSVPFLWFALFRREDMVTWKGHGLEGLPAGLAAPVALRRDLPQRLESALALLERTAPKAKTWDVHLRLLGEAIDALDRKWKYVTCEWEEIVALDPKGFLSSADWLLRFFGGQRVQKAYQGLSEISGMKLHRPLRDPVGSNNQPWTDDEEKTLACLLGNDWKKSVPWWPKPVVLKKKPPNWFKLISRKDLAGVKRALPAGTPVPKFATAHAAYVSPEILEFLLTRGGDPDDVSPLYGSAILAAFNYGGKNTARSVSLLLNAGADVNFTGFKRDNPSVLYACLRHGMEFAGPVLKGANKRSLEAFMRFAASDAFPKYVEEERLAPWAGKFVAIAKRELAKRELAKRT